MTMVLLKRRNVPLDRDVIFLAESGEEGNSNFGIQFMVAKHFAEIDAEYCFAEGGGVTRIGGAGRSSRPCRRRRRFRAASSWWRTGSPATDRCR